MTAAIPNRNVFTWPLRVYWEDTDAGGIVYYANYLRYFERARTEWLRALGIEQSALRAHSGAIFVVAEAQLRYRHPARLDDALLVTAEPTEISRAGLTIKQQAWLKEDSEARLLCEASVRVAWVNASTYKPTRIPPSILELLK